MYKVLTSSKEGDTLQIKLVRGTGNKLSTFPTIDKIEANWKTRLLLEDVFGVAEHQKDAMHGLGHDSRSVRKKW